MSEEALRQLRRGNTQGALDALIREVVTLQEVSPNSAHTISYADDFLDVSTGNAWYQADDASVATGALPDGSNSFLVAAVVSRRMEPTTGDAIVCAHSNLGNSKGWMLEDLGSASATTHSYRFSIIGDGVDPLVEALMVVPARAIQRWNFILVHVFVVAGTCTVSTWVNGITYQLSVPQPNFGEVVVNDETAFTIGAINDGADGGIQANLEGRVAAVAYAAVADTLNVEASAAAWMYDQVRQTGDLPAQFINPDWVLAAYIPDIQWDYIWSVKRSLISGEAGSTWRNSGAELGQGTLTQMSASSSLTVAEDINPQFC
jgi:hypothetical protein